MVLKAGTLAYWDTIFSGLVPCKVVSVIGRDVRMVVTADHKPYKRGETVETTTIRAVPRKSVSVNSVGQYVIKAYTVERDA